MCVPGTNSNLTGQLENQHTVLWVNSFQGDECLYLLSPARGKSAPVWRDSLCTDCAFDCLICAEVAADLMGPLLLWSWDPVWNFSSPANRDWHESDLRMFYSVSSPSSPSISTSCSLGVVSHWFQSLQQCLVGSSKQTSSAEPSQKKGTYKWRDVALMPLICSVLIARQYKSCVVVCC